MDDSRQDDPPQGDKTREEIRAELDERDSAKDFPEEDADEREEDQAWAGNEAMEGQQPTG